MLPEDLKLVSLSDHDVDDALTLSKEVKWNQNAEDWMMIRQGKALGLKTTKKPSQLVATHIEGVNACLRAGNRRLVRKTTCFPKNKENHLAVIKLMIYYRNQTQYTLYTF